MNQHENRFIEHVSPLKGYSCTHEVQNLFFPSSRYSYCDNRKPLQELCENLKGVFSGVLSLKVLQDGEREMASLWIYFFEPQQVIKDLIIKLKLGNFIRETLWKLLRFLTAVFAFHLQLFLELFPASLFYVN